MSGNNAINILHLFIANIGVTSSFSYYMNSNSQKIIKLIKTQQENMNHQYELQMKNLQLLEDKINQKRSFMW